MQFLSNMREFPFNRNMVKKKKKKNTKAIFYWENFNPKNYYV